jgi:hypothetical protein
MHQTIIILMLSILRQKILCSSASLENVSRNVRFNKIQPIDTCKIIPLMEFLHDKCELHMDMFWNKWLSILKLCIFFVVMSPKFLYSHT